MNYQKVITLLTVISEVVSGFYKFDVNHLLLKLDRSRFNLSNVQEKWIEQPLDHFNPNETRTLKMRYFENLDLWRPNGPIYTLIGGEAETNSIWISADDRLLISQMAKETDGALYATEHRYYGKSLPDIPNNTLIEYYTFLSSQQAIADLANFIKMLKSDTKYKWSKVVVISGSYSGSLAAWLRELHPELVDAAVASSAPVLAKKNFHEYFDGIRYTLGKYGTRNCLNDIENKYKRYERLLQSTSGIEALKQELNICSNNDLTLFENQQLFFYLVYRILILALTRSFTPNDVQQMCNRYQSGDEIKQDYYELFQNNTPELRGVTGCVNIDFRKFKPSGAWTYQACNEFGYFQTTSSEKQPFVHWNPLQFYLRFCKYLVHGDIEQRLDEGIARTNKMYGGRTPEVSKVVFTNGDMDPWSALGVLRELGPDAYATVVKGTPHCAVLIVYPGEPKELTQNREYVKRRIKTWIST